LKWCFKFYDRTKSRYVGVRRSDERYRTRKLLRRWIGSFGSERAKSDPNRLAFRHADNLADAYVRADIVSDDECVTNSEALAFAPADADTDRWPDRVADGEPDREPDSRADRDPGMFCEVGSP
jgi:hypothetical protein